MLFPNENSIKRTKEEFQRLSTIKYAESSKRFQLNGKKTDYSKQFAHIYSNRLEQMRPLLQQKAVEKWGEYQKPTTFDPIHNVECYSKKVINMKSKR